MATEKELKELQKKSIVLSLINHPLRRIGLPYGKKRNDAEKPATIKYGQSFTG